MTERTRYIAKAEQVERLARETISEKERAELLKVAEEFRELAARAESPSFAGGKKARPKSH